MGEELYQGFSEWTRLIGKADSLQDVRGLTKCGPVKGMANHFSILASRTPCVRVSCLVMSDSVQPHRLQSTRPLHPWDSPGKNSGVGCHFLLQKEL